MEKKISFGFSKISKKQTPVSQKQPEESKVEFIDCWAGQEIKIKSAPNEETKAPLLIPLEDNKKNLLDRIKEVKAKQKDAKRKENSEDVIDNRPDSELTIDELATRTLLKEAKEKAEKKNAGFEKIRELPLAEDKLIAEGGELPTLEDYDSVPIGDYGLAMLRGMGWKEGGGIGKNAKVVKVKESETRPKGLGLGADKMVAEKPTTVVDKDGKELVIKPQAFAKIIAGKYKDQYCQVQSLDDEKALIIVKTAIKGEILNLDEVFLLPVTREEYDKCSRVLNNKKYEEYKEISDRNLEKQRRERAGPSVSNNADLTSEDEEKDRKVPKDKCLNERSSGHSSKDFRDEAKTSHKQRSSSEDSDDFRESRNSYRSPRRDRSKTKYHREKSRHSSSSSGSTSSDSDSEDNRHGESSRRKSKSKHKKSTKDGSGCSKSSKKHKKEKKNRHKYRSKSSSSESGYEQHNRRRKNKTKSRHRRYSNDESEENYKNRKSKR